MSVEGTGGEDQQIPSDSAAEQHVTSDLVEPADPPEVPASDAAPPPKSPSPPPQRICLTNEQLQLLSKEDLANHWAEQDKFIDSLLSKIDSLENEAAAHGEWREGEERLRAQLAELQRKEHYHVMRLATKEHELQDLGAQVQEAKGLGSGPGHASMKQCLLDPAVNLLFERLKRDLDSARAKMEETQNELAAWKFTPDSNTGKQLMAKCRLLIKENEELGRMISSGRLAKLEGDLALQRNFSEELKKSQSELDEFLLEMDEDTEGMQGTIYYLQQQLRQAKDRVAQLTTQLSGGHNASAPQEEEPKGDSKALDEEGDVAEKLENTPGEGLGEQTPNGDHYRTSNDESIPNGGRKRAQSDVEEDCLGEGGDKNLDSPSGKRTKTEEPDEPMVENGVESQ